MKIIIKYGLFFLCLLSFNNGYTQEISLEGKWFMEDYKASINFLHDYTEEERDSMKKEMIQAINSSFDQMYHEVYINFLNKNKFRINIGDNKFKGTYKRNKDTLIMTSRGKSDQLMIVRTEKKRQIHLILPESQLASFLGNDDLEKAEQPKYEVKSFTLIFERIYDEPYEEYLNEKWLNETFGF